MLKIISSMATRELLTELLANWQAETGNAVALESVGGVDAAKRVQMGEAFDVVVLASDAIDKLLAGGQVVAASRIDLVLSSVALAVKRGAQVPDIGSEAALRAAVGAAERVGYSTGPSGVALFKLFERWGMPNGLAARLIQAPAGVAVGTLIARGEVSLGFQQLSELIHLDGITIAGMLPKAVAIHTIFSAAVCSACIQRDTVEQLLLYLASGNAESVKLKHGMQPIVV